MDMECEHAFITGKKMSPFARAVTEIFNFFSVRDFWATLHTFI
jgi:hypothetical protein